MKKRKGKSMLGYVDTKREFIEVETDQPEAGKYSILLHELIHIADEKARQNKCYKKPLTEPQVTFLAGALFPMLAYSGLLKGVTKKMLKEFYEYVEGIE